MCLESLENTRSMVLHPTTGSSTRNDSVACVGSQEPQSQRASLAQSAGLGVGDYPFHIYPKVQDGLVALPRQARP